MSHKNMKLFVLIEASGDYDAYTQKIVGIVTDLKLAQAWRETGVFDGDAEHDVEITNLNILSLYHRELLEQWLDPKANPMCECGHRLLHHRRGKRTSCKHNSKYAHNKHACSAFRLKKEETV